MAPWTSHEILCALRDKLEPEGWVVLPEVRSKDGPRDRYADAIAVNLWSSRGHEIAGYEFKSSRADLLRELRDPAKGEASFRKCDKWWIVLGEKSLANLDEIPPTWGVMFPRGQYLVAARQAPRIEAVPIDRAFLASLLRRAKDWQRPSEEIEILVRKTREEERKASDARHECIIASIQSKSASAIDAIQKFNHAAGVNLQTHNAGHLATEYKMGRKALAGCTQLRQMAHWLSDCAKEAEEMAELFRETGERVDSIVKSDGVSLSDGLGI